MANFHVIFESKGGTKTNVTIPAKNISEAKEKAKERLNGASYSKVVSVKEKS